MRLIILILILGLILLAVCLYRKSKESFVPGKYVIQWQAPAEPGDSSCCGYDWQVCNLEDTQCAKPVDSGSVAKGQPLSASTSNVSWGDTYNVMVRAKNAIGTGPWTTAQLVAGGGTLEKVVFGQTIDSNGNVVTPLSVNSQSLEVWASISPSGSQRAGTLSATAILQQIRGGNTIDYHSGPMTEGQSAGQNTFSLEVENLDILIGDVFKVYIYVVDGSGQAYTDGQGTITLSASAPGPVTGISWAYVPFTPPTTENPLPPQSGQGECNNILYQMDQISSDPSLEAAAILNKKTAFASSFMGNTLYGLCTDQQKGYITTYASLPNPNPSFISCAQLFSIVDPKLTNQTQKCGAITAISEISTLLGRVDPTLQCTPGRWSNWENQAVCGPSPLSPTATQLVCQNVAQQVVAAAAPGFAASYAIIENAAKTYPWWAASQCDLPSNAVFFVVGTIVYVNQQAGKDVNDLSSYWSTLTYYMGNNPVSYPYSGSQAAWYQLAYIFNYFINKNMFPGAVPLTDAQKLSIQTILQNGP